MTRLILASLAAAAMLTMLGNSSAVAQQYRETDLNFLSRHAGSGSFSGDYFVKKQTHTASHRGLRRAPDGTPGVGLRSDPDRPL